ncbi:MAG: serine hydrolase domain-containing protein [Pseudomonadota bacterium]
MPRFFSLFVFVIVLAGAASAHAQAPDPSPTTPVETVELAAFEPTRDEAVLEAFIDGIVASFMHNGKIPGVTVSVVSGGKLVFAKGYGFADLDEKTPVSGHETLFRIGSVSKTFTWTAVMMLAERGFIDLDADVNQYLQGMEIPDAFDAPVTLNDLMAHRAGFEESFKVFSYDDEDGVSLTDALKADMPARVFPPGARTSYSNWGSALAAKIVEDVAGVPYEKFIQEEILTPLAMSATTIKGPANAPADLRARTAVGYKGGGKEEKYMQLGPYAPAGGIASTGADMAQWMLVLLGRGEHNGVRLYSDATAEKIFTRNFTDRVEVGDFAHGFMTKTHKGQAVFGHGGATSAFLTYMQLVPELDFGVFVSQNIRDGRSLVYALPDLVVEHVAAARGVADMTTPTPRDIDVSEYVGKYLTNRRSFSTFTKLFSTNSMSSVTEGKDGSLFLGGGKGRGRKLTPLEGVADTFEQPGGGRIVFGRDARGRVTHYTMGSQSHERAGLFTNVTMLNAGLGAALLLSLTTLAGAWRRAGRPAEHTPSGKMLGVLAFVAAISVFVLAGGAALVAKALMSAGAALSTFPPPVVVAFRMIALAVFGVAILAVAGIAPAWLKSGWGVWRKLHYSLFAVVLAFVAVMLVAWRAIFSAVI